MGCLQNKEIPQVSVSIISCFEIECARGIKVDTVFMVNGNDIKFVQLVLNGEPATRAYMQAFSVEDYGTAATLASRLLKTIKISKLFRTMLPEMGMDLEEFKQRLKAEAISGDTSASRIKALALIGKTLGAYTENLKLSGTISWREFLENADTETDSTGQ